MSLPLTFSKPCITNPSCSHLQPWIGLLVILALSISGLNANANSVRYQPDVEKLEAKTLECDLAVYGGTPE